MKFNDYFKTVIYVTAGILVLVLHDAIMLDSRNLLGIIVAGSVTLYAIDISVESIRKKRFFGENALFFGGLVQILIALALFLVRNSIPSVCIVWAVWGILRESKEMSEALHNIINKRPGYLSVFESIIIIGFSFTMIMRPSEEHASMHVYILGIELILEVTFPLINLIYERYAIRRAKKALAAYISKTANDPEAAATETPLTDLTSTKELPDNSEGRKIQITDTKAEKEINE